MRKYYNKADVFSIVQSIVMRLGDEYVRGDEIIIL